MKIIKTTNEVVLRSTNNPMSLCVSLVPMQVHFNPKTHRFGFTSVTTWAADCRRFISKKCQCVPSTLFHTPMASWPTDTNAERYEHCYRRVQHNRSVNFEKPFQMCEPRSSIGTSRAILIFCLILLWLYYDPHLNLTLRCNH